MGGGYVGGQPARPVSCILCSLATSESRQVFRPSGQKWHQKNMNAKQAIQKCIYQRKQLNFSHLMNISRLLALWRLTYRYCTFFRLPVVGIVRRRARRRIPQFGRIIYCLEKASTAPLARLEPRSHALIQREMRQAAIAVIRQLHRQVAIFATCFCSTFFRY